MTIRQRDECSGRIEPRPVVDGKLQCTLCLSWFPPEGFNSNGKGKRQSRCRSCQQAAQNAWRKRVGKGHHAPAEYKVTVQEYVYSMNSSEFCITCGSTDRLVYDHCHTSGKFRGVLCHRCNAVLGFVGDDPNLLRNLVGYLEK